MEQYNDAISSYRLTFGSESWQYPGIPTWHGMIGDAGGLGSMVQALAHPTLPVRE